MITINDLTVRYGQDNNVIQSLNLDIPEGTINGIVGRNGAGKTTLLNTAFGLKKAEAGTIQWKGESISKKDIAYLVAEPFFYKNITGNEYLSLFRNGAFDTEKWNTLFQLPLNRIVDEYSTGMKKKLAVLSIIKQDKPILILDEPFNSLDLEASRNLRLVLLALAEKRKTIIVTSHILETLTNLCDSIHYLEGGQIRFSKERAEFGVLEKELFGRLEAESKQVITELLK